MSLGHVGSAEKFTRACAGFGFEEIAEVMHVVKSTGISRSCDTMCGQQCFFGQLHEQKDVAPATNDRNAHGMPAQYTAGFCQRPGRAPRCETPVRGCGSLLPSIPEPAGPIDPLQNPSRTLP